jgi:hypothetical protein
LNAPADFGCASVIPSMQILVGTPPDAFAPGRFAHPTRYFNDAGFAPALGLRPFTAN